MRILISPLDWGLGHATRSIPLIKACLELGHEIVLAARGDAGILLKENFPNLKIHATPGYTVHYSKHRSLQGLTLASQLPALLASFRKEHQWLSNFSKEKKLDAVISDGRYGLWQKNLPSYLITHQVQLLAPDNFLGTKQMESILLAANRKWFKRFDEVWVPDFKSGPGLSGRLGHTVKKIENLRYLGPLSRFSATDMKAAPAAKKWDLVGVVSGPEPQRSALAFKLEQQFTNGKGKRVLILGKPDQIDTRIKSNTDERSFWIYPHAAGDEIAQLYRNAKAIVVRSGYTTVMELASLNVFPVIMIPTPGQTEQEYLAKHLAAQGLCVYRDQKHFELDEALIALQGLRESPLARKGLFMDIQTTSQLLKKELQTHPILGKMIP